jgi:hypothetical protein
MSNSSFQKKMNLKLKLKLKIEFEISDTFFQKNHISVLVLTFWSMTDRCLAA